MNPETSLTLGRLVLAVSIGSLFTARGHAQVVPLVPDYLVSTAGPDGNFIEKDPSNNTAWVGILLARDSKGNAKTNVVDQSPCDSPALCGIGAPNR